MPPFLKRIRTRTAERIDRAAAGTPQPAGSEPEAPASAGKPSARERGAMRRRLRRLARMREAMLLDLGALTFEMHRQERHDPALIERKASEALALDAEARALARALDEDLPFSEVIASGIAGTCAKCEAIVASDARYCSSCGTPVGARAEASSTPDAQPAPSPSAEPQPATPDTPPAAENGNGSEGRARPRVPWSGDLRG